MFKRSENQRPSSLILLKKKKQFSRDLSTLMSSNPSFNEGHPPRLKNLAQQLRIYESAALYDPNANPEGIRRRKAAILIGLFEDDEGVIRVILTKRSSRMSSHSGEVSLPGGMSEEGDADDAETATREAKEEIGLEPSLVNVVAILQPFLAKNHMRVTPVIGILWDIKSFKPALNPSEVEVLFDAPLEMFLKEENWRSQEIEDVGRNYKIHFFDYKVKNKVFIIWGLTAEVLIQAASLVYQRPPSFVKQMPNFKIPLFVTRKNFTPRM